MGEWRKGERARSGAGGWAAALLAVLLARSRAAAAALHDASLDFYEARRLVEAELLGRTGLAIREPRDPRSGETAIHLGDLGNVLADRGDLAGARELYARALAVFEQLSPGS